MNAAQSMRRRPKKDKIMNIHVTKIVTGTNFQGETDAWIGITDDHRFWSRTDAGKLCDEGKITFLFNGHPLNADVIKDIPVIAYADLRFG